MGIIDDGHTHTHAHSIGFRFLDIGLCQNRTLQEQIIKNGAETVQKGKIEKRKNESGKGVIVPQKMEKRFEIFTPFVPKIPPQPIISDRRLGADDKPVLPPPPGMVINMHCIFAGEKQRDSGRTSSLPQGKSHHQQSSTHCFHFSNSKTKIFFLKNSNL